MGVVAAESHDRLPFSPAVGCLLSVLAGALCAAVFFGILWLNQQGEIAYAPDPLRGGRLWLVRGADASGVGLSITRRLPGGADDQACALTTVRFFTVTGPAAEPAEYCECFAYDGRAWSALGPCGD